tara:strand:- start:1285 stop:1494 length:210 start_codon:yes stop_codon:yes gene_type:complete
MKTEDILKAFIIFIISTLLTFDICYYFPPPAKEVEHIDVPMAFVGYTTNESETNSVLHLPLIRIGSGIR